MIKPVNNNFLIKSRLKNNVAFGSIERAVHSSQKDDKVLYMNNTYLFRNDMNWNMLASHIIKEPKVKKIYCYACSDGSEPYSLALTLIKKLGYEKAQKYFPIIARDIDLYVLNMANAGVLSLSESEIASVKKLEKKINIPIANSFPVGNCCGNDVFKISEELRTCVDFGAGNFVKESAYADYKDSVILFRNVWPYLKPSDRDSLTKNLSKNSNDNTLLVIGSFDRIPMLMPTSEKVKNRGVLEETYIDDFLFSNSGFSEVKPFIYKRFTDENGEMTGKACMKYLTSLAVLGFYKKYCYIKASLTGSA